MENRFNKWKDLVSENGEISQTFNALLNAGKKIVGGTKNTTGNTVNGVFGAIDGTAFNAVKLTTGTAKKFSTPAVIVLFLLAAKPVADFLGNAVNALFGVKASMQNQSEIQELTNVTETLKGNTAATYEELARVSGINYNENHSQNPRNSSKANIDLGNDRTKSNAGSYSNAI